MEVGAEVGEEQLKDMISMDEGAAYLGECALVPVNSPISESGILYFMDCLGNPPEAYEHDMKLWWPHNEALIASMMIYRDTKDEKYLDIFYQILDYCKQYFADEYGEWYGYLRRDGKPTQPACKGSTFKGPFHVPRCLILVDQMMSEVLGE